MQGFSSRFGLAKHECLAFAFFNRYYFQCDAQTGGNQGLKEISSNDFQVSILEFGPSTLSNDELLCMESRWKEKLLSKKFGLNR